MLKALDADLQPMRERIAQALREPDDKLEAALQAAVSDLPALFAKVSESGRLDKVLEETLTASVFNGLAEQAAKRKRALRA